jgi:ABC-type uncharacterized transport system permease subunit
MIRPVVQQREEPLYGGAAITTLGSIVLALIACGVVLRLYGVDPFLALYEMGFGAFGDTYAISETLVKATPLLLCGLGVSVAFTTGLWNIGAEGQIYAGALGASWVALSFPELPSWMLIPAMSIMGMIFGALWALGPAYLKAKLQVNEIITTLMMNYVAISMVDYFVYGPWRDPTAHGFPMSALFSEAALLPTLGDSRVHLGLAYGIVACFLVWMLMGRTKIGFVMRVTGSNRIAARVSGMPIVKVVVVSMLVSGALAGLAGMGEVSAIQGRLRPGVSPGYGYTAIIIAWLAWLRPQVILLVAVLMGALMVGGETLQFTMKVPPHLVNIIQGLILFFVLAGEFVARYQVRWLKESEAANG